MNNARINVINMAKARNEKSLACNIEFDKGKKEGLLIAKTLIEEELKKLE